MNPPAFATFQELATTLLAHWHDAHDDGAHDTSHLQRVWKNAAAIQAGEGGDAEVLCAATLLHDCVAVEKDSPLRAQASRLSADKAREVLKALDWPDAKIDAVAQTLCAPMPPLGGLVRPEHSYLRRKPHRPPKPPKNTHPGQGQGGHDRGHPNPDPSPPP